MNNVVVDTREIETFAKKLGTLPKQALPSAVRNTLNSLAFDVKQRSLPISARKNFENRSKNFFKANSAVKQATGFNLQTMHSVVGMSEDRLQNKKTNYAVKDLEQQEQGGTIDKRSFVPMKQARTGNSNNKTVRKNASMQSINGKRITQTNRRSAKTRKQQFIRAAFHAVGKGDGLVLGGRTAKGGRTLFKIDRIQSNRKSKKLFIKFTPLYNVQAGRKVKVKATHFMEEAAKHTTKKTNAIFKKASEFQFQKHLKV